MPCPRKEEGHGTTSNADVPPERAPFDTAQARPSRRSHQRLQELHELIARRAYEIFESKGRAFGRDLESWLQAESELLHPVHVDLRNLTKALRFGLRCRA
ncbi:MAG: hypothetical protein DMG27_23800 [Acidobacteria bacterium]|nr:MAG: hypothetical protein DMG27_23800 [Acidobacteriota bacterium]